MPYIYKITNDVNDKVYIGKTTKSIETRFNEHKRERKRNRCKSRPIYQAMNKYGFNKFHIDVVEECSIDKLDERESFWINEYNSFANGYNFTTGGVGKPKVDHDMVYELFVNGAYMDDICEICSCCRDTVHDVLIKYGVDPKIINHSVKMNYKYSVLMIDKDTNIIIKVFDNVYDAARFMNKPETHIRDVCTGLRKTAYGYVWKYLEDEELDII